MAVILSNMQKKFIEFSNAIFKSVKLVKLRTNLLYLTMSIQPLSTKS